MRQDEASVLISQDDLVRANAVCVDAQKKDVNNQFSLILMADVGSSV